MGGGKRSESVLRLACGAAFLALLDVTVVNLAIPDLLHAYESATVTDVSWVITLYATVFSARLAPAGRLADVVGRRALFQAAVAAARKS
jgi:MFS family permease